MFRVHISKFRIKGSEFGVGSLGFIVKGLGLRLGFGAQGVGIGGLGFGV
jgi:hypothetical protein